MADSGITRARERQDATLATVPRNQEAFDAFDAFRSPSDRARIRAAFNNLEQALGYMPEEIGVTIETLTLRRYRLEDLEAEKAARKQARQDAAAQRRADRDANARR